MIAYWIGGTGPLVPPATGVITAPAIAALPQPTALRHALVGRDGNGQRVARVTRHSLRNAE